MEFYIYNGTQWNQVYVEIEPKLTKAWDTTNDSFSCVLKATKDETPYKPMTPFKIIDDEEATTLMWIVSDSVEVFSIKPLVYKHRLSLVQYRYFLNKHLIRNTVFNQPRKKNYSLYGAISTVKAYNSNEGNHQYRIMPNSQGNPCMWTDSLPMGSKAKVKSVSYFINLFGTTVVNNTVYSQGIGYLSDDDNVKIKDQAEFYIYDENNSGGYIVDGMWIKNFNQRIVLTPSQIETLNDYIDDHPNAILKVGYYSGVSTNTDFTNSFATVIVQGTSTYVNLTAQITFSIELYNYTMYEVIDTMLKQHRLQYEGGYKRDKLFNLPASGELYDLLNSTYPPDTLSFTQATWYDALQEIFRFYDAGFKFDENKTLQIEYYNDPKKDISSTKLSGRNLNFAEKGYNNGKVAYYQNAIADINIPIMATRSESYGVPGKSDYGLLLPYPIYDITRLDYICYFSATLPIDSYDDANNMKVSFTHIELDLTYFLLNNEIWTLLPKTNTLSGSMYNLKQMGTIPFSRGSKFIGLSNYDKNYGIFSENVLAKVLQGAINRFFGFSEWSGTQRISAYSISPDQTTYHDQKFSIDYLTENNGRFKVETLINKYDGEELNNQSNGGVDLNKLGLNILGESLKGGEPTLSANCQISNWEDRIQEGDFITYNGEKWMANIVTYTPLKDGVYMCNVEFSKNFNALAMRVRSDNEKRLTAISRDLAVVSEDTFVEYIYVTTLNFYRGSPLTSTILDEYTIESLVGQTFGINAQWYNIQNISYGVIVPRAENGLPITYYEADSGTYSKYLYIPMLKYGAGNCICFEMQYSDPINAGNRLLYTNVWGQANKYFSQATPYTDEEGWANSFDISLVYSPYEMIGQPTYFPVIADNYIENNQIKTAGKIERLRYYKKTNEIFGLNYELCFLPLPDEIDDVFIGNDFINHNFFVDEKNARNKKFYLYYSQNSNDRYTILDKKGIMGSGLTRLPLTFGTNKGNHYAVLYAMTESRVRANTWSICDEEGNIYFAENRTTYFDTTMNTTGGTIYFMTSKARMTGNTLYELPETYPLSGSLTFTVSPNDWLTIPNVWYIKLNYEGVSHDTHISSSDLGDGRSKHIYTFTTAAIIFMIGKTMDELYIIPGEGMDSATISFDSSTGTFSGTITRITPRNMPTIGMEFNATGYYRFQGQQVGKSIYKFSVGQPNLQGINLSSYSISPSSTTIDGIAVTNTITFSSTTGIFYGQVNQETQPNTDVTYTITFSQ